MQLCVALSCIALWIHVVITTMIEYKDNAGNCSGGQFRFLSTYPPLPPSNLKNCYNIKHKRPYHSIYKYQHDIPSWRPPCPPILNKANKMRLTMTWLLLFICFNNSISHKLTKVGNTYICWKPPVYEQGIHPHPGPQHIHISNNVKSLRAKWPKIVEWDNVHSLAIQETWLD